VSTPGWYPDPGGRAGHLRFWDGQTWAPTTTADPAGAAPEGPPSGGGSHAPRRRPRRARRAVVLVALAVALVLVVAGALLPWGGTGTVVDPGPPSTGPTTSGGDTSTSATPESAPTLGPATSGSPTTSETASTVPCPVGDPFSRQDHPRDGRVHGGALSFRRQPGWTDPGEQASAFTWAYDLGETDIEVEPQRFAAYAVGAVSVADGFEDPQTAAELMMQCTVASALYADVTGRTDLVSEETTVDGYPAWSLRSEVRTAADGTASEGDTVQITVVDLDSPEALAFFWGSAPIGDPALTARLDSVVDRLRVG